MPSPDTQLTPADRYAQNLETQLRGLGRQFLVKLVGTVAADRATAKIGLAMRQLALANPDIYQASPQHIANAVALCALTDLTPGGQNADCWVFPKATKGVPGIQFMISHRGYKKLARRAGYEVDCVLVHGTSIDPTGAEMPYDADEWLFERNPFPTLRHVPHQNAPTWDTVVRAYCYYWPIGQREEWGVYILEKNELHRRRNLPTAGPVWDSWPLEMCLKATVKAAAQRGAYPLDEVGRHVMDELDQEAERDPSTTIDISTSRPAPAPQRTHAPSPRLSAVDDLSRRLGPDDDDDTTGPAPQPASRGQQESVSPVPTKAVEPAPTVDVPDTEVAPERKPRSPRAPKPVPTPEEAGVLNEQAELIVRVREGEARVGQDQWTAYRNELNIPLSVSATNILSKAPIDTVKTYCKLMES